MPKAAPPKPPAPAKTATGTEPQRHVVKRGETAYSIARMYNVSVRSLADWNGLDAKMTVREGQTLLIPVATGPAPKTAAVTAPGAGSPTPEPPSAACLFALHQTDMDQEIAACLELAPAMLARTAGA